jgi:hypothetical protein
MAAKATALERRPSLRLTKADKLADALLAETTRDMGAAMKPSARPRAAPALST